MTTKTQSCVLCHKYFEVTPADQDFCGGLGVPNPTHCPQCRMQRRLAFRNERTLYKRACDLCHGSLISLYPVSANFPVYCTKCWWSDAWDSMAYGRDYDPGKGLFEQIKMISDRVPHLGIPNTTDNVNSEYCSWLDGSKNCYLIFGSSNCEDMLYGELLYRCRDSLDLTNCVEVERSYNCVNSQKCYNCVWVVNCVSSSECYFCFDARGSNNCFLSTNLRNKSYYFLNQPYAREEWFIKVKEILGSHEKMRQALDQFRRIVREEALHRYANATQIVNSTGNDLVETKNAKYCFDSTKLEDCSYVSYGENVKDCRDAYAIVKGSERCYELLSGNGSYNSRFVLASWDENVSNELSQYIIGSKDTFASVGLRKKQHCILNKQYNEEEYLKLKDRIIVDMRRRGEYGEYFPIVSSDFAYNETLAQDYYPLTKEEALRRGYAWNDNVAGSFGKETMALETVPDKISDVPESIIEQILACEKCKRNYRIIPRELQFYRKLNLPIPRLCTNCRYYERLSFRNPRELWSRNCMCLGAVSAPRPGIGYSYKNTVEHFHTSERCPKEFETTYSPERTEIVYDEACYQAEVV